MDKILLFNDKIISLFNSLDGRDKVFKFAQYFSKFLYHCIEKKYLSRILLSKLIKNKRLISKVSSFNESLVLERLKSLEDSLYDARTVYRIFGFFREFSNLIQFFRSIISSFKQQKKSNESIFNIIFKSLKSFTNISNSFLTTLELIDHSFNFISEINDIIFYGTQIKIFQLKESRFDFVCKLSNFVWVYSLAVFSIKIIYSLISTIIQIYKLKTKKRKLLSSSDEINQVEDELVVLYGNRTNEIKSLISAIGEFGLCICSIYEIENNGFIGICGFTSAFISLQEIWLEISQEQENSSEEKEVVKNDNHPEQVQFALICPPQIHSSHQ